MSTPEEKEKRSKRRLDHRRKHERDALPKIKRSVKDRNEQPQDYDYVDEDED